MSRITFKLSALNRIHLAGKKELLLLAEFYDVEGYEDMNMEMLMEALEEIKSSFSIVSWLEALSSQELDEFKAEFDEQGEIAQIAQNLLNKGFHVSRHGTLAKLVRF